MYSHVEESIECVLGNREIWFLAGNVVFFSDDSGIRGIYLSLTLGTAKFKQLD